MKFGLRNFTSGWYRALFATGALSLIFFLSLRESYLLFHTIVELLSIIVAFAVFIITWNSRRILDNNYLFLVGISYFFIGCLDLLHTLTYTGMQVIRTNEFYANQFWVATRFLEAVTLFIGFYSLDNKKKINAETVFVVYFIISVLISLSILSWKIFPVCYIEGQGQTTFKIYTEYFIILILTGALWLLLKRRRFFTESVFRFLLISLIFTIAGEFCFTLYISNYSISNQIGHYAKLISFYLIYKANIETGFTNPSAIIFKGLKDKEEEYRTLAENLPEMIMRFDTDLRCVYSNNAVRRFLPGVQKEITGLEYSEIGLKEDVEKVLSSVLQKARKTQKNQIVDFNSYLDGTEHFFSLQVVPEFTSLQGEETYLMICFDITTLKLAEKELRELNATKDKFFSIIAHDLKNPFTSLLGYSQLLASNASKLPAERVQQVAERLHESSRQTYALLENLLHWARIQTGNLSPVQHHLSPAELLDEASRISDTSARAKGIEIKVICNTARAVFVDRQMINTVLRNLVSNAVKFSFPGSLISVKAEDQEQAVVFSVSDSGVGIEDHQAKDLLKIGSTQSTIGTANEKGTGLGLILCKEFVEVNGGNIWFTSRHGEGTTFFFSFPATGSI